jgi:hypothetical protein
VDTFFHTLARGVENFYSPNQKTTRDWAKNNSLRENKTLVSGFLFLLAKPEFYSHLAGWRVVIRTPAVHFLTMAHHDIIITKTP